MLNLGQVEIVDTWKEGKIRFQKMVTVPDYERCVSIGSDPANLANKSLQERHAPVEICCEGFAEALSCRLETEGCALRRWVPTIGRKYVKEEDIMFYDTIAYDPQELDSEEKGFRMHVTSYLPLLGDKVCAGCLTAHGTISDSRGNVVAVHQIEKCRYHVSNLPRLTGGGLCTERRFHIFACSLFASWQGKPIPLLVYPTFETSHSSRYSAIERVLVHGQMTGVRTIVIKAVDENHCRHSVEGDINIKVFGVGRLAEKTVIDSTVKTFKALPTMVERSATHLVLAICQRHMTVSFSRPAIYLDCILGIQANIGKVALKGNVFSTA